MSAEPIQTTLCYIRRNGRYLLLLRNKKAKDPNEGKWVGVGGKFLPGETPEECLLREVREETGWELLHWESCGVVKFLNDAWPAEDMHLFVAEVALPQEFGPEDMPVPACDEGTFAWVAKADVLHLNLWEGDRAFLEPLMAGERDLSMTLVYHGDALLRVERGSQSGPSKVQ